MSTDNGANNDQEQELNLRLSRRRALQGAAWSVPVISLATAAPAYAAFSGATVLAIGSPTLTRSAMTVPVPVSFKVWNGTTYTTIASGSSPTLKGGGSQLLTVNTGSVQATGTGSETVTLTITITGQATSSNPTNTATTTRGAGQYGTHNTADWALATPTLNNTTKVATYIFTSVAPVVAGTPYPALEFILDNGSGTGATVYAFGTASTVGAGTDTPVGGVTVTVTATAPGATQSAGSAST